MRKLQPLGQDLILAALAAAARRSDELRFVHRLHVVLLVSLGRSCYEVGHWFAEDPRTIERWVHAYERGGIEALLEHHGGGRPTRLTTQQQQQVARDLMQAPGGSGYQQLRWSGKLLVLHLERRYGVRLSLRHCQRLIGQTAR